MITPQTQFVKLLARRLHEYGAGAHRLEGAVKAVASRVGLECEVFSTPTSAFLTFREPGADESLAAVPSQMMRLNPGTIDLGRLCVADAIAAAVSVGEMGLEEGIRRLEEIPALPPAMPLPVQLAAWGLVGAAVTTLFGGGWADLGLAAGLGIVIGALSLRLATGLYNLGSFEPIAAFLATMLAYLLAPLIGASQVPLIVIGALIVLMPGLDLTVAITELSTRHLASGTARFAGAVVTLLKLALGVMLATQIVQALGYGQATVAGAPTPDWFGWTMVVLAGLGFAVLFDARPRDYPVVVLAALVAYTTNHFAGDALGPDVGVFLAALVVAALSNAYARLANRPATLMRLPGIILLVPGSLGYRALTLMFSHNLEQGLEAALSVVLVLASLVGGLLLGNTLVPPRRNL